LIWEFGFRGWKVRGLEVGGWKLEVWKWEVGGLGGFGSWKVGEVGGLGSWEVGGWRFWKLEAIVIHFFNFHFL